MKSIYIFVIFLLFIIPSCDYTSVDPNRLTDVEAINMIAAPMILTQFFHQGEVARQTGVWTNHFQYQSRSLIFPQNNWLRYLPIESNGPWSLAYQGVAQCRIIVEKTEVDNPALSGVAKILEAHIMGTVTSLWGDAPFSDAFSYKPTQALFDSQESIYSGLQLMLDDAIEDINSGGGLSSEKDLFYQGDLNKWVKLAYSLKARYYLHIGDFQNALANALLGISTPNEDMIADYGEIYLSNMNPFCQFFVYDRSGYIGGGNAYAPGLMDPFNQFSDPYNANRNHAKHFEGDRYYYHYHNREYYTSGYEPNYLNGFDWNCQDCGKFGEDMSLVTYGEMLLIISECDARINGLSAGVSAYNNYRQLINSGYGFTNFLEDVGWDFPDYVDSDFSPGGVEDPLSTANIPLDALLREIYEERYVYLTGNIESFTDLRRTNNLAEIKLQNYGGIPQRLLYPESEIDANRNVPNPNPDVLTPTWAHSN